MFMKPKKRDRYDVKEEGIARSKKEEIGEQEILKVSKVSPSGLYKF